MSEVWPFDERKKISLSEIESIRPFKCLLLMPFESRFDQVAEFIKSEVSRRLDSLFNSFGIVRPEIKRLDWITSVGAIQQQIWREILEADIIFCDITGYNPNVMFECGVCAAWKDLKNVILIKDKFFKQQSAFDIAPIRYTEYEFTSDGIIKFEGKIEKLIHDVIIAFPDLQGSVPKISLPLKISFEDNKDDIRIYTPPYSHRRVVAETLEFGSRLFFDSSWASIGKEKFNNFEMEFSARFSQPTTAPDAWIGVGLRSQHFFANFAHIFYVNSMGQIIVTEPNEVKPPYYEDKIVRDSTPIDLKKFYHFRVQFDKDALRIQLDDFSHNFELSKMGKVLGPGLIRFQAYKSWMAIKELKIESI